MNDTQIRDNDLDTLETEYEQAEKIRETHPYFSHDTDERETYMCHCRETNSDMSDANAKKARLMYKRLELLILETKKHMGYEFLYEIGFIEIKYKHWRQGRYTPTKQQLDTIAAFYNVTPDYFETGILPYISIPK